jgi:hypothetical protein
VGSALDFRKDVWRGVGDDQRGILPRQEEALDASYQYRYLLYGGTRGCAKSNFLRWGMTERLIDWHERGFNNVRAGLFSEDYPTLEDRQITKIETEFPKWLGSLKTTRTDGLGFYLKHKFGGGKLLLRNLDKLSKYVGAEMAGMGVEELTHHQINTFNSLRGSLRWPGIDDTFWWGVTNPLGIGLVWVRALWVEGDFARWPELTPLAPEFYFVQGHPQDNPYLSEGYWADLMAQPEHVRKAWIEGDWYTIAGVMFEELRPVLHKFPARPPLFGSTRVAVMDWGWTHKTAVLWVETVASEDMAGNKVHPRSYVYREYVTSKTDPITVAQEIIKRSEGEGVKRLICDSAALHGSLQDGSPTPGQQMMPLLHSAGISIVPSTKGQGSRERGHVLIHTYLYPRRGGPLLAISSACPQLWEQVSSLVIDETHVEDTSREQEDDVYTALRYWAQDRPQPPAPTVDDVFALTAVPGVVDDPRSVQAALDQELRLKRLRAAFPKIADKLPSRRPARVRTPWDLLKPRR